MLEEWFISLVCEEFGGYPADAIENLNNDVNGLIFKIMDLRNYHRSKQAYDEDVKNQPDMTKRRNSAGIDRVRTMVFSLAKERMKELQEKANQK